MFTSGWSSARLRKLLLGAALFILLMLTVPHFMATTSGAYKLAVETAHQTPHFTEALGTPVTEAWFSGGKEEWENPATAEMLIPVRGRMRSGNLRVRAIKNGGRWRLTELTLELTQPDESIDLMAKTPI
jgi:Cytochrome oxidase complex assembly protein 1